MELAAVFVSQRGIDVMTRGWMGLFFAAWIAGVNGDAQAAISFGYELSPDKSGGAVLRSRVDVSENGMWLGITLRDSATGKSRSFVYPVKRGLAVLFTEIDPEYMNGSFEAALWKGRLAPGTECTPQEGECRKSEARYYGMRGYFWGQLMLRE